MLTGDLPYETPSAADVGRLLRGEMLVSPRLKNPKVPKDISDIVLKAMAPEIHARYQRAGELLDDVLANRGKTLRPTPPTEGSEVSDIKSRVKASRESPQPRFCWHCRKPLHARSDRCPFWARSSRHWVIGCSGNWVMGD
jgi:serine/threonine-protein kinase